MTRVEKSKYTYIYNCSNRPEVNEFISLFIKDFSTSPVSIFQTSLPNYVKELFNENTDETTRIKISFRFAYGSLGLFPNSFWSKIDDSSFQIDFPVSITIGIDDPAASAPGQPIREGSDLYVPSNCFVCKSYTVGLVCPAILDFQENKIYLIARQFSHNDDGDSDISI